MRVSVTTELIKIIHTYSSIHCCVDELTREEDVLEWLVHNKSTGDEDDVIEDVTAKTLDTLIGSVENLVVLFCKYKYVKLSVHAFDKSVLRFVAKNNANFKPASVQLYCISNVNK